jgi:D-3-phosphoglycerate dehydrogenase
MKILVTSPSFINTPGPHLKLLNEDFDYDVLLGPNNEETMLKLADIYDGMIVGDDSITENVLKRLKRVKAISKYGVGLDGIDLDAAKKMSIKIKNCTGVNADTVAEYLLGLIILSIRGSFYLNNLMRENIWLRENGRNLKDVSVGFVGFGSVGKACYKLLEGKTKMLSFYDPYLPIYSLDTYNIKRSSSLEELMSNVDVTCLTLSLTNETKGIINYNLLLSLNKTNLMLINVSRGGLVVESDICAAIDNDLLEAYVTDVLESETNPFESVLHKNPKVFITPHIASKTTSNILAQSMMAFANIKELLSDVY